MIILNIVNLRIEFSNYMYIYVDICIYFIFLFKLIYIFWNWIYDTNHNVDSIVSRHLYEDRISWLKDQVNTLVDTILRAACDQNVTVRPIRWPM